MGYIMDLRKVVGHRPLIMPCGTLIITDGNDNFLLQKRVDDGMWALHGGSIELNESAEDAMKREVKEELGLNITNYKLLNVYSGKEYYHIYPNKDEVSCIDIVYVSIYDGSSITLQESEVSEVRWFNYHELPEDMFLNNRKYIEDYMNSKK